MINKVPKSLSLVSYVEMLLKCRCNRKSTVKNTHTPLQLEAFKVVEVQGKNVSEYELYFRLAFFFPFQSVRIRV